MVMGSQSRVWSGPKVDECEVARFLIGRLDLIVCLVSPILFVLLKTNCKPLV